MRSMTVKVIIYRIAAISCGLFAVYEGHTELGYASIIIANTFWVGSTILEAIDTGK